MHLQKAQAILRNLWPMSALSSYKKWLYLATSTISEMYGKMLRPFEAWHWESGHFEDFDVIFSRRDPLWMVKDEQILIIDKNVILNLVTD